MTKSSIDMISIMPKIIRFVYGYKDKWQRADGHVLPESISNRSQGLEFCLKQEKFKNIWNSSPPVKKGDLEGFQDVI